MNRLVRLADIWAVIIAGLGMFVSLFRDDIRGLSIRLARAINLRNSLGGVSILLGLAFQYVIFKVMIWVWPELSVALSIVPLMAKVNIFFGLVYVALLGSEAFFFVGIPQLMSVALLRSGAKAVIAGSRFNKQVSENSNYDLLAANWIMRNLSDGQPSIIWTLRARWLEVRSTARTLSIGLFIAGCYGAMILQPTLLYLGMLMGSDMGLIFGALAVRSPLVRMVQYLLKPLQYRFRQGPHRFRFYL